MAPTAPSAPSKRLTARQKARARLADPLLPRKLHRENNVVTDAFISSKRDKRQIKHSAFVSRVASSSSVQKRQTKRRRPSKKLATTLESLGDALEDIQAEIEDEERKGAVMDAEQARQGKVRHKSLKSRPGALKRKERLVKGEMERFGRSLAQLANIAGAPGGCGAGGAAAAAGNGDGTSAPGGEGRMDAELVGTQGQTQTKITSQPSETATSSRWAALRGFIAATMEQNPAFLGKT